MAANPNIRINPMPNDRNLPNNLAYLALQNPAQNREAQFAGLARFLRNPALHRPAGGNNNNNNGAHMRLPRKSRKARRSARKSRKVRRSARKSLRDLK